MLHLLKRQNERQRRLYLIIFRQSPLFFENSNGKAGIFDLK
jgi:hypothetical protein